MSEETKNSEGQDQTTEQEKKKMHLHLDAKDKLRAAREVQEKVWGKDPFLPCLGRAIGKLIFDVFARSFVMTLFFAFATYHYIERKDPSEVITAILACMTAVFALYWIEKKRGGQLWEAIIHRVQNGTANKF